MLVFGEDLGMVPRCVPDVMRQLGILSMEIQRMPKNPAREFFHPAEAPYLSVVTPSTHDMSTIRGWWEEDRAKTQRFYNYELGQWGEAPQFCEPWINRAIILQHLNSPAQWCVFQLQDIMGMSETFQTREPQRRTYQYPGQSPSLLALSHAPDPGRAAGGKGVQLRVSGKHQSQREITRLASNVHLLIY